MFTNAFFAIRPIIVWNIKGQHDFRLQWYRDWIIGNCDHRTTTLDYDEMADDQLETPNVWNNVEVCAPRNSNGINLFQKKINIK